MVRAQDVKPPIGIMPALEKLIGSPELCSRRWVWEQYDHVILGNTVQRPGGDAAVVRVQDGPKGLAITVDVTPRYCEADPYQGGMQAVAEAWRNITAVGGRPLAITDNLNFGNPERPEIMGQFVGCLKGISEACRTLDFPVVSGNVSLYNETNGRGILPTPSIGGVGLLDDFTKSATLAFKADDEAILLIGDTQGWLGQSVYLRDICGREEGAPPPVDLAAEKRNGDVVRGMIHAGTATAVHDISDGGLLIALAEMAMAGGIGAQLLAAPGSIVPHAYWFGEDQARYIVTVPAAEAGLVLAKMKGAGVPCVRIGTTGGDAIAVADQTPVAIKHAQTGVRALAAGVYERQGVLILVLPGCEAQRYPELCRFLQDGLLPVAHNDDHKHPLRARNLPQRRRRGPAQHHRPHECDQRLDDRGQIEIEQPVLQPQHDRIVHQEHAVGVCLHRIEHAGAGLLVFQEVGQDHEQDRHAEQREAESIVRLVPFRQQHRIAQDFALDVDQQPHQAIRDERQQRPVTGTRGQLAVRRQQPAIHMHDADAGAEEEIARIEQHAAMLDRERPELEPAAGAEVNSPGNVERGGDGKHHDEEFPGPLVTVQRQAVDRLEQGG